MSIDESMDTQDNQQMQDVVSKQLHLEKMKLPETTDALEMITEDPGFAIEFLTNIKQMQNTMNLLMDHQCTEERRSFLKQLKSSKLIASTMSIFTSVAALIDVMAMMNSDCKAYLVMNTDEAVKRADGVIEGVTLTGGQMAGIAIGFILIMIQVLSALYIMCSYSRNVKAQNQHSGDSWLRKLKYSCIVNDLLIE